MADIVSHASLTTSLLAYWKLEESSGTRDNIHSAGFDLTANGTGGVGSGTGKINTGADFVRTDNDYLEYSGGSVTGTGNGASSVSMWTKWDIFTNETHWLFGHGGTSVGTERSFGFYIASSLAKVYLDKAGADATGTATTTFATDGTWYHIVYVYNGTNVKCYINNSLFDTVSPPGGSYNTGSTYLNISSRAGHNSIEGHDGIIDEVGFWSKALSTDEITDLYNSGNGLPYEASTSIKTVKGLAKASVKTVNGLAIASVKTINGLA